MKKRVFHKRLADIKPYLLSRRVITATDCWELPSKAERPTLRFSGRTRKVYQWAALVWLDFNVWNTFGWQINHRCDNPRCFNPKHLWIGTQQENMDDKMQKGRFVHGAKPCGERHHAAKLTDERVREIRQRKRDGETHISIARDLEVGKETIGRVWRGRNWSHVK